MSPYTWTPIIPLVLLIFVSTTHGTTTNTGMMCKYSDRGSLTAVCINATATLFKNTIYRFDHLDETLICQNCNLSILGWGTFDINGNKIQVLNLSRSNIQIIKERAFTGLVYLETLVLSDNSISKLEVGAFHGARKIKRLFLERALKELPKHVLPENIFKDMLLLRELNLNNNDLAALEQMAFFGLTNLERLDVSHNKITELNVSLIHLVNLKTLFLNNNSISIISNKDFDGLRKLVWLDLSGNDLKILNLKFGKPNNLIFLNLSNNMMSTSMLKPGVFGDLHKLEILHLCKNWIVTIPRRTFEGLLSLKDLYLMDNLLSTFCSGSFTGVPSLRTINVSHNFIKHPIICGRLSLPQVHTIDFSNNPIDNFDYVEFLKRVPSISKIWLSGTKLNCKQSRKIEEYSKRENIHCKIDFNQSCPELSQTDVKSADEELKRKFQEDGRKSPVVIAWKFSLLALILVLVGILFYVQFFILNRRSN